MERREVEIIIFDMDGTLSILGDRLKYLRQTPKNWDAFYSAVGEDLPNIHIRDLYNALADHYRIMILTGRRESCREETWEWLEVHGFDTPNFLLMRPSGDHRHDTIIKPELLKECLKKHKHQVYAPTLFFEDRSSMVKKWRELGYTCLQVADGNF
jgi:hypothetical protein